jgi:hypothetical protein
MESRPFMPKSLAHIVAQLILLVLEHLLAAHQRHAAQFTSEPTEQPNPPQPAGSTPAVAACGTSRRRGGATWRKEFPQLARLLAVVRRAPPEPDNNPPSQSEPAACETARAAISPGVVETSTTSPVRSPRSVAHAGLPALRRQRLARAATGPPADCDCLFCFCLTHGAGAWPAPPF